MTIREHLRRLRKRLIIETVAVWVVAAVLWVWLDPHKSIIRLYEFGIIFYLAWFVVFILIIRTRYVCPRCGGCLIPARLGFFGRPDLDMSWYWQIGDKCPRCGVGFDEPCSRATKHSGGARIVKRRSLGLYALIASIAWAGWVVVFPPTHSISYGRVCTELRELAETKRAGFVEACERKISEGPETPLLVCLLITLLALILLAVAIMLRERTLAGRIPPDAK